MATATLPGVQRVEASARKPNFVFSFDDKASGPSSFSRTVKFNAERSYGTLFARKSGRT